MTMQLKLIVKHRNGRFTASIDDNWHGEGATPRDAVEDAQHGLSEYLATIVAEAVESGLKDTGPRLVDAARAVGRAAFADMRFNREGHNEEVHFAFFVTADDEGITLFTPYEDVTVTAPSLEDAAAAFIAEVREYVPRRFASIMQAIQLNEEFDDPKTMKQAKRRGVKMKLRITSVTPPFEPHQA